MNEAVKDRQAICHSPLFCDALVLERCNLRCRKCYSWKSKTEGDVAIDEYKDFIASLKELVKMPFEINLGGGEPFLKKDIFDLIDFCSDQGLHPVISTNANLIDEAMAKRISGSGLHRLSISLDSLDENAHDFITGTPGAYERLMRAIGHLKQYWQKGRIHIHTVILEQNADGIIELAEWVNNDPFFTGVSFIALAQPFQTDIINRWHTDKEYGALWPKDHRRLASIIDTLIDYKNSGYKILNAAAQLTGFKGYYRNPDYFISGRRCNLGDYVFNVNILGCVQLCCFLPPVGNIKRDNIKDIWYSQEARRIRTLMHNCRRSCNNLVNCYFREEGDPGNG